MVDLSPDEQGRTRPRLLDLVPGRSGRSYADWLAQRGEKLCQGVGVATLDPLHGYENAIDDQLADAASGVPRLLRHRLANNGGTEAINGLIELHRRIACGFRNRDDYRLRMLLIGGGLRM